VYQGLADCDKQRL